MRSKAATPDVTWPVPAHHRSRARLAPPENEAHVWLTDGGEQAPRRPEWLDAQERTRWKRLLMAADRDLFLVAHSHLRNTLSRYADVLPSAWRFAHGRGGRPEIDREAYRQTVPREGVLRFNLSHAPGLVACVVCAEGACGVDVEREGRVRDWAAVAPWLLHPDELAHAHSPDELLATWTLKEAYVKATGHGIREPLGRINLAAAPSGWALAHLRPTATHHLAVALRPGRGIRVHWA